MTIPSSGDKEARGGTIKRSVSVAVAVIAAAVVTGCGVFMNEVSQVRNPLSPEQAKAQVIEAARDLKAVLGIAITDASVFLESCNDQGEAPFRSRGAVGYPLARSREEALAQTAGFLRALEGAGWTILPADYKGMPPYVAEKDGVRVIFEAQGSGNLGRVITLLGECRDITTTKPPGGMEPIPGL
jgi:hypothetical protein